jgi:hypothetical protein
MMGIWWHTIPECDAPCISPDGTCSAGTTTHYIEEEPEHPYYYRLVVAHTVQLRWQSDESVTES